MTEFNEINSLDTDTQEELEEMMAPISKDGVLLTQNEQTKRSSFKSLAHILDLHKSYTSKLEEQLETLKSLTEVDNSVTKEIEVNGIIVSIKFKSGEPVIPLAEAFAVNLAATKLVQQLISTPEGKPRTNLECDSLDLGNIRDAVKGNSNLEYLMET